MEHKCDSSLWPGRFKQNYVEIKLVGNEWTLITDDPYYSFEIVYCPFCGENLVVK